MKECLDAQARLSARVDDLCDTLVKEARGREGASGWQSFGDSEVAFGGIRGQPHFFLLGWRTPLKPWFSGIFVFAAGGFAMVLLGDTSFRWVPCRVGQHWLRQHWLLGTIADGAVASQAGPKLVGSQVELAVRFCFFWFSSACDTCAVELRNPLADLCFSRPCWEVGGFFQDSQWATARDERKQVYVFSEFSKQSAPG